MAHVNTIHELEGNPQSTQRCPHFVPAFDASWKAENKHVHMLSKPASGLVP